LQVSEVDQLSRTWSENPDLVREFIDSRPQYEQLCSEVAYILDKRLDAQEIEVSAITCRAKSLKSFTEKLTRKNYACPEDVTDIAGVRLVYLYKSDRSQIEKLIEAEFDVIEKVDKVEEQDEDRFGYGALHYLVHIGRKSSGARYDDLKNLICEIQVRTVLQDAWAIVAHHLSYKEESDIPKVLRRKLNSLSGLFETADDQFEQVRSERKKYQTSVKRKGKNESDFLSQEINLDTFKEFLKWKFPNKKIGGTVSHPGHILSRVHEFGYKRLSELNVIVDRTAKARDALAGNANHPAAGEVAASLAFLHPDYRSNFALRNNFADYEHLIAPKKGGKGD